jgi:two-component system, OmpR family, response regulator VanR
MLTAKIEETDKITGLTLGADDYVTKPFRPLEVVARVKAQLRRYKKYSPGIITEKVPSELSYNKLCLNVQTHECLLDGETVSLTPTEFSILQVLLGSTGNVVSIEELFHAVWKDEYYSKNSSTITVHIRHLPVSSVYLGLRYQKTSQYLRLLHNSPCCYTLSLPLPVLAWHFFSVGIHRNNL